ncbi:rRNA biogenesis protein rrp36 [Chytriomyces hyalinus]|nr:rRNA biogenesis protein rrp36 [Chytriomyces hyalinus]
MKRKQQQQKEEPKRKKVAKPWGVLMVESETESEEETQPQRAKAASEPRPSKNKRASNQKGAVESIEEDDEDRANRRMQMMDFADGDDSEEDFDHEQFDEADQGPFSDEDEFAEDDQEGDDGEPTTYESEDENESSRNQDNEYDDDEDDEDDDKDQQLKQLQSELAEIPFGQLIEVAQTMGSKEFKRVRRGMSVRRSDGEESDTPATRYSKNEREETRKKKAEIAKRGSKHAPAEQTSKKPVSRRRDVVEIQKKEVYRDPRFNKLSGKFNEGLYKRSYGFLDDYEKSEIADLRVAIKKEKDADKRAELEMNLQRKVSKQISKEKEEKRKSIARQWKKAEMAAVKDGKKPFYLKKADQEKLALYDQYKNLKSGSVDKFLEKRRKKNSASEKRFLPRSR